MRKARFLAFLVAVLAAPAALPANASPLLAPHRAVYDLALGEATDRSGIEGLVGRMVYEFNGSPCDGYTVTFRFVTRISTQDVTRMTDQQTTTYEDGDGKGFNFVTKSYVDRVLDTETKGNATIDGDKTHVDLQKPVARSFDLEKTQFPTQHLLELIGRAKKKETFYETTLFDGSDEADRIMTTTVVIGQERKAGADDPEHDAIAPIADQGFWPVDIAYFDLNDGNGEEVPSYRIAFKLYENGITRDLVMDYGEFSMTGRLVDLALLDPVSCSQ